MMLGPRYKYEELTRDEVLSLKEGDICYILSSYGMQECTYPRLNETHRHLFWSDELTKLGYTKPKDGIKTQEMIRDWGTIYKKTLIEEQW